MKSRTILFCLPLLTILIAGELAAQVPAGLNFQAVARDHSGELLTHSDIGVRIAVLEGSDSGPAVYTETHQVTTGGDGLFHLVIGQGDSQDDFSEINWSDHTHFVRLETDAAGGTDYEELGVTELFSVPYAMVAQNVIDGISVGEEPITVFNLNTTEGDTSFTINSSGSESLSALRINAETDGQNIGVRSNVLSKSTSGSFQVGLWGNASGDANASHYGLISQSNSKGRYNYGTYGSANGEGSGEIVLIGEESEGYFGSFNIGGGFYSSGNINGNLGVEGVASGSEGQRINIGVEGRAIATSGAENIGVNGFAHSSPYVNYATSGIADGSHGRNVAIRGLAFNGESNVGGYFSAEDTAAVFHGPITVVNSELRVNGEITHTGDITQTSDRNLKEDLAPLEDGLSTIMQLRPMTYRYRGNGSYKGMKMTGGTRMGLIAQEVEPVLPSLVSNHSHQYTEEIVVDAITDESGSPAKAGSGSRSNSNSTDHSSYEAGINGHDAYPAGGPYMQPGAVTPYRESNTPTTKMVRKTMEYKSMNYTELIPVLIKAVQEQQEEIEQLREELARLQQ